MGRQILGNSPWVVALRQQLERFEDKITVMQTHVSSSSKSGKGRPELNPRRLSLVDLMLDGLGQALASNHSTPVPRRPTPVSRLASHSLAPGCAAEVAAPAPQPGVTESEQTPLLTEAERRHAAGLMRVNHVGEVCAQALYQGQAAGAQDPRLRAFFVQSGLEEGDHLAWTRQRLDELEARPSVLNPLWYAGAYALGLLAARAGDARSLGFTVETERQVEEHLAGHMDRLPAADASSRAIVAAMKDDEAAHAAAARRLGAAELPTPVKSAMRLAARVMTTTAYRI